MFCDKPATTIDEQIALMTERSVVGDQLLMRRWLETVGYYRLSAYRLPLELPAGARQTWTKIFQPGTLFDSIVDIYVFDRKLRLLVMEGIERIEVALRSRWTNRLTLAMAPMLIWMVELSSPATIISTCCPRWQTGLRTATRCSYSITGKNLRNPSSRRCGS